MCQLENFLNNGLNYLIIKLTYSLIKNYLFSVKCPLKTGIESSTFKAYQ
ncbi:hypothetical protein SAMN06265220_105308 [Flavobacterium nitrogenifigens]|uniref:Uncharacterized protein n=1 Tax=Flavobacterium nitrogenifigens TaxID=1617283 RepID=A0A521EYU8_9FLAO|nr:hypothetical protein SAMN06265220_105308 [Flavobacterium nitrogenifigens]